MSNATIRQTSVTAGTWVRGGIIAGIVAGIAFAMFEMAAAAVLGGTGAFFMPLRMIGAIAVGKTALDPSTSLLTAGGAGLVVHMALSMMYGVAVAAVLELGTTFSRSAASVIALASFAGFALWVVNFFVLAGVFGWTWFPDSQNVAVQFIAHTFMFGTVLGLVLNHLVFKRA